MKKLKYLGFGLLSLCLAQTAFSATIELGENDYLVAKIPQAELDDINFIFIRPNENLPSSIQLEEGETIWGYIFNKNVPQTYDIPFEANLVGDGGLVISIQDPDALNTKPPRISFSINPDYFEIKKNTDLTLAADGATFQYVKSNVIHLINNANETYKFLQKGGLEIRIQAIPAVCGDGKVEGTEECDDGNQVNDDECSNQCIAKVAPVCGNGIVEPGEECDDGNQVADDECNVECKINAAAECGNNVVEAGEECDDGNQVNDDQCSNTCVNNEGNPNQDNGGCSLNPGVSTQAGLFSFAAAFLALGAARFRKNS